jgi:hypothetical protein
MDDLIKAFSSLFVKVSTHSMAVRHKESQNEESYELSATNAKNAP